MTKLPKFDETSISVEDGVLSIQQMNSSYQISTIKVPLDLWPLVYEVALTEIEQSLSAKSEEVAA
jgi:hypothetical protein